MNDKDGEPAPRAINFPAAFGPRLEELRHRRPFLVTDQDALRQGLTLVKKVLLKPRLIACDGKTIP